MTTQRTQRFMCISAIFICLLIAVIVYVGSYIALRNRGMREIALHNTDGMLYDSTGKIERTHDLTMHHYRARLFAPLNFIDQLLFGGKPPVRSILFDLS